MKIVIINNLFPPFERGGAEALALKQAAELTEAGHRIILITTKPSGSQPSSVYREMPVFHLDSHYLDLAGWPFFLRSFWHLANVFSWRKFLKIKRILIDQKPDMVITHNLMGVGFMTPLAIKQTKTRHEHWLHDIQLIYPSGLMIVNQEKKTRGLSARLYQCLNRQFFSSPAKIISPSRWLMSEHRQRGFFSKSSLEISGRQPSHELNTANRNQVAKKLLFVGQLEEHKGVGLLIKAFKNIKDPSLSLEIVGNGRHQKKFEKLADEDRRIIFTGRLAPTQVLNKMKDKDLLVVPSLCYENSPTVIHEAHEANLAVLASNLGGIPEILTTKDRLFKAGDDGDLSRQISDLTDNPR